MGFTDHAQAGARSLHRRYHRGRDRGAHQPVLDRRLQRAPATRRRHRRRRRPRPRSRRRRAGNRRQRCVGAVRPRHPGRRESGRRSSSTPTPSRARGGARVHDAIDIMAPRGTPVVAAARRARSRSCSSARAAAGSPPMSARPTGSWIYYYAHLQAYAPGPERRPARAARRSDRHGRQHRQRQSGRPAPPFRGPPHGAGRALAPGHARSIPIRCLREKRAAPPA